MKGLTKRRCTENMIDLCIDVMEDLFTPFPDSPGSFHNDKERITKDFLCDDGGATLFFKDDELVGFCGHKSGHFTEVCVRKEYQGKGYGEVIVRSVLKSVYESGYDAELTTGNYNERAIALYQKTGFKKVYESIRVYL
jgi:ribosomal protein S18 acetylase RimI-like enzyme